MRRRREGGREGGREGPNRSEENISYYRSKGLPLAIVCSLDSVFPLFPKGPPRRAWAMSLASAQMEQLSSDKLTCALPNIRSLNHSSARCSLAKGDLIYDGIFFNDSTTLYAKAVPSCGIVFNDRASTIIAYNLGDM